MTTKPNPPPAADSQAEILATWRTRRVGLRSDIEVTRLSIGNVPSYVLHDPVSFRNHRLSLDDYRVVAALNDSQTALECYQSILANGDIENTTEIEFYQFLIRLQTLGLLALPVSDVNRLYHSSKNRKAAEFKGKLQGFLSVKVPLTDPDRFLDRSVGYVRWMFTRTFGVLWLVAVISTLFVLAGCWSDFHRPLQDIVASADLLFMLVAFVGLKVLHELGHGYACKVFGGRVPEMGMMLMAGMPLAYVDASSAWGFRKRSHRLMVLVGGVYFESFVGLAAFWIWIFNSHNEYGSYAQQLINMAAIAAVLFNINPLMKFDGYYVLCELIGVPNFRQRADACLGNFAKRMFLGIPMPENQDSFVMNAGLFVYGFMSLIYRWTLVVTMGVMICWRFVGVGVALAAYSIGFACWGSAKKTIGFLLSSPETESIRPRCRKVLGLVSIGLIALAIAPVPFGITVRGLLRLQNEQRLYATSPGFIESIHVSPGQFVNIGQSLVTLKNIEIETAFAQSGGDLHVETLRHRIAQQEPESSGSRLVSTQSQHSLDEAHANWEMSKQKVDALNVVSPTAGYVQSWPGVRDTGRYLSDGMPIGIIGSGQAMVMVWLSSDQLAQASIETGTRVKVRLFVQGVEHRWGIVESIAPQSNDRLSEDEHPITVLAGEPLLIDPKDDSVTAPLYKVAVRIEGLDPLSMRRNVKATVCLPRKFQPMLLFTIDRVRQFLLTLYTI